MCVFASFLFSSLLAMITGFDNICDDYTKYIGLNEQLLLNAALYCIGQEANHKVQI